MTDKKDDGRIVVGRGTEALFIYGEAKSHQVPRAIVRLKSFNGGMLMPPSQARDLAKALELAADRAEGKAES